MKITQLEPKKWKIDFTLHGHRIRKVIFGTRKMAKQAMDLERAKIHKLKYGIPEQKKNIRFNQFKELYIEQHSKRKKSYKTDLVHLRRLSSFFGNMFMAQISPLDVLKYQTKRAKEVAPITVNREIGILRTMFNKAIEWEKYGINRNPVSKVKPFKEDSNKDRVLTLEEMEKLLEASQNPWGGHLPLFLVVALNTGMRKMEILSLKWEHLDFKNRFIHVTADRSKSGKPRRIEMNECIETELRKAKNQSKSAYVFDNKKGSHIRHISCPFNRACEKAGINDLTIHDLRHTAASYLVNYCGMDVATASKILGHAKIETTMRYLHPSDENRRKGLDELGKIFEKSRHKVDSETEPIPFYKPVTPSLYYN